MTGGAIISSMSVDLFDARNIESVLPDGWAGWVEPESLRMTYKGKSRPWCRGRPRHGQVEWFPRTSQDPFGDERFAVFSPEDQLHGLKKPGWWICNLYRTRPSVFHPEGNQVGILPRDVVDQLYRCLATLYWDR